MFEFDHFGGLFDLDLYGAIFSICFHVGVVVSLRPLAEDTLFQISLTKLNTKWSSSVSVGVIGINIKGGK